MSTQIIDDRIDFSAKTYNHPSPMYLKLNPLGGSTAPALSASATVGPISFQLPSKVFNLSKSYFSADLTLGGNGTSTFLWMQGNLANMISRVVVSAVGSNTILADITNAGNFAEVIVPPSTYATELFDKSCAMTTGLPSTLANAQLEITDDISRINYANNWTAYDWLSGGVSDLSASGGSPFTAVRRLYYQSSATGNTTAYASVRLNLDAFKHTILALNKNMYFGGQMVQIDLYMEAVNRYVFSSTAQTSIAGATAYTGTASLSNVQMYLQVEQNISIVNSIIQQVMTNGLSIPIPYVFNSKLNISNSSNHNFTLNISNAYGSKLLAVLWSPFANAETSSTQKGHSTYQLGTYNTYLNSVPITSPAGINPLIGEEWLFNRDNLTGSAVQDKIDYDCSFFHCDNFTGMPLCDLAKKGNYSNGIDLSAGQQVWQLSLATTASTSLNHYVYFITQKQLVINSQAVLVH